MAALLRARTCSVGRRANHGRFSRDRSLHDMVESSRLHSNTPLAYRRAESIHSRTLLRALYCAFSEEKIRLVPPISDSRSVFRADALAAVDRSPDANA